jgi:hypothetical protein
MCPREALDEPPLREDGDVVVDGAGRCDADRVTELPHRRGVAAQPVQALERSEELPLPFGQVMGMVHGFLRARRIESDSG